MLRSLLSAARSKPHYHRVQAVSGDATRLLCCQPTVSHSTVKRRMLARQCSAMGNRLLLPNQADSH